LHIAHLAPPGGCKISSLRPKVVSQFLQSPFQQLRYFAGKQLPQNSKFGHFTGLQLNSHGRVLTYDSSSSCTRQLPSHGFTKNVFCLRSSSDPRLKYSAGIAVPFFAVAIDTYGHYAVRNTRDAVRTIAHSRKFSL